MRILTVPLLLAALTLPAGAEQADTASFTYDCERGAVVQAAYLNLTEFSYAVIAIEGRQLILESQEAASGARYASTGDQPYHVWWTKGDAASLYAGPDETAIYSDCVARPQPASD